MHDRTEILPPPVWGAVHGLCPVATLLSGGVPVGIRAACPSLPPGGGGVPFARVLTISAPPGEAPSASVVTVPGEGFDPVSGVLPETSRGEPRSVLCVLRDLGVLAPARGRADWEVGVASHLRRTGAVPDLEASLAAAREHMRPYVALVASLFDPAALAACDLVGRSLELYDIAGWLDDSLWPLMDGRHARQAPLLRALEVLPQHADILVAAARRNPDALAGPEPADLLRSAVAAVWEGEVVVGRALSARVVGAASALAELSSPAAMRRCPEFRELPHLSQLMSGPPTTRATAALLRLTNLPPSWIPDADGGWEDCLCVLQAVSQVLGHLESEIPYADAVGCRGGWGATRARLSALLGDRKGGALRAARETGDVVEAFMRQVLRPAVALAEGADAAGRVPYERARAILFGRSTVERALGRSNEWHARQAHIDHALSTLSPEVPAMAKWGKGFPDAAFGDVEVVVLDDGRSLSDEGRPGADHDGVPGLSHCVGGYADKCATGRSRILSIGRRLPGGGRERLSTVELRPGAKPRLPEVVQHSSGGNGDPCVAAEAALAAYMEGLASGVLAVDEAALRPVRGPASAVVAAGYDFRRPGAFAGAMAAWRPVLPGAVRDWGPHDFLAAAFPDGPGPSPMP